MEKNISTVGVFQGYRTSAAMKNVIKSLVITSLLVACGNDNHEFSRQENVTYKSPAAEKYAEKTCPKDDEACYKQVILIYTQIEVTIKDATCKN
jgi:hypothetical protein